jgi:hypothetical protein
MVRPLCTEQLADEAEGADQPSITAGFSERDPHRMMHMRDLDEGLV